MQRTATRPALSARFMHWLPGLALLASSSAQAASFFLSPTPLSQTVCFGEEFAVNIRVNTGDGYSSPVKITFPNLPAGFFLLAAGPNPITPGSGATVFTRLVKTSGSQGPVDLTIRGLGANQQSAQTSVVIDAQDIPAAAVLRLPEEGFSTTTAPTLEWTGSMYSKIFQIQISTDQNFAPGTIVYDVVQADSGQSLNTHTVNPPLTASTTYYWRIRGISHCGDGLYSAIHSFVTDTLFINGME